MVYPSTFSSNQLSNIIKYLFRCQKKQSISMSREREKKRFALEVEEGKEEDEDHDEKERIKLISCDEITDIIGCRCCSGICHRYQFR